MNLSLSRACFACLVPVLLVGVGLAAGSAAEQRQMAAEPSVRQSTDGKAVALTIQYLEIVTPAVAETCAALAQAHGVVFSQPVAELGNARVADLANGGRVGVRAPMRASELPIVRPYVLVDDIESAIRAAEQAGAQVAIPPLEIPGQGTFSIYILGGIEHGLWQKPVQEP